jgi:hypothetical protein
MANTKDTDTNKENKTIRTFIEDHCGQERGSMVIEHIIQQYANCTQGWELRHYLEKMVKELE